MKDYETHEIRRKKDNDGIEGSSSAHDAYGRYGKRDAEDDEWEETEKITSLQFTTGNQSGSAGVCYPCVLPVARMAYS